jgi:hypothetical protein
VREEDFLKRKRRYDLAVVLGIAWHPAFLSFGAVGVVFFEESMMMVMFMKGDDGQRRVECRVINYQC